MRRLYIDTEFTQLNSARQLISLALVDAHGHEFYVEINDTWTEQDCSDFVKEIVLPQLDLSALGLPVQQARSALKAFLASLGTVEVIGDALAWDWPLFLELLGPDGLPANVLGCREIAPESLGLSVDLQQLLASAPHHALLDARILAEIYQAYLP
jgi:hypothetical protein